MYQFVWIAKHRIATQTKSHQQQNSHRGHRNSLRCLPRFAPRREKPNQWRDDCENPQSTKQEQTDRLRQVRRKRMTSAKNLIPALDARTASPFCQYLPIPSATGEIEVDIRPD